MTYQIKQTRTVNEFIIINVLHVKKKFSLLLLILILHIFLIGSYYFTPLVKSPAASHVPGRNLIYITLVTDRCCVYPGYITTSREEMAGFRREIVTFMTSRGVN